MYCFNKISSTIYAGSGDPLHSTGSDGDVYFNICTLNFLVKSGCYWRVIGTVPTLPPAPPAPPIPPIPPAPTCNVIANVDFANPNVGAMAIINVLANDTFTSNLNSLVITAPLDPVTEGTLTYNMNPIDGLITFTPAPRFLDSAIFGYQISGCGSTSTSSTVGKITANKSYSQIPAILYANATRQLFILNLNTFTSSVIIDPISNTASEIASNRGDALLYYTDSAISNVIYFYDNVLGETGVLLNYNTYGFPNRAESLGFDNERYFLYVGFNTGNIIAKIAVNPYDRYVTPLIQTFSVSSITIPVTGEITEITVQESTGFLYATIIPTASLFVSIYKIDPITGAILASVVTPYSDGHISFANNGLLYGVFGPAAPTDIVIIDQSTLAITILSSSGPSVTDLSELLFNM